MIINCHSDYPCFIYKEMSISEKDMLNEVYLPKLRSAGVSLELQQVGVDYLRWHGFDWNDHHTVTGTLNAIKRMVKNNPVQWSLITSEADLRLIENGSKTGILLSLEGAASIDPELVNLQIYYTMGLRALALTHNPRNIFASGCQESPQEGLSTLGRKLVEELNTLDITLDLVHINEAGFFEALKLYQKVPIVSHSNTKFHCNHFRNLNDQQIEAIASRNGVIGLNFMSELIDSHIQSATVDRLIDHIEYIVNLVGINHVGLGPDYTDYFTIELQEIYPSEISTIEQLPNLQFHLERRGFSKTDIERIFHKNILRVIHANLSR